MAIQNLDQSIEAKFKLRKQNKISHKARVCTYLNFDGKTEEAFLSYKNVFKTEFIGKGIQRFGDNPEEADPLFLEFSAKGYVTMPMAELFFGAYFGKFSDKYGISWMINFQDQL